MMASGFCSGGLVASDERQDVLERAVRQAFVAGALRALDLAGLTDVDMALVLQRMLITAAEVNDHTLRNLAVGLGGRTQ
jgi:hypothetical protein